MLESARPVQDSILIVQSSYDLIIWNRQYSLKYIYINRINKDITWQTVTNANLKSSSVVRMIGSVCQPRSISKDSSL
jgi:hypothetical protein